MTDKHTPWPWFVNGPNQIGHISVCSSRDGAIANMTRHQIEGRTFPIEANARLIAAAPLMLDALRGLTGQYIAFVSQGAAKLPPSEREDFLRFHHERTDAALAAIRAATGEDA